jgi:hypothetical protein
MRCTTLYMNGVSGSWIESSLARLFRSSVFRFPNSYLPFAARTRISPPHEQFIRRSRTRQLTGFSFSAFRFHASALLSPRTRPFCRHEHVSYPIHEHVIAPATNTCFLYSTITFCLFPLSAFIIQLCFSTRSRPLSDSRTRPFSPPRSRTRLSIFSPGISTRFLLRSPRRYCLPPEPALPDLRAQMRLLFKRSSDPPKPCPIQSKSLDKK